MKTPGEYFESKEYVIDPCHRMIYLAMFDFAKEYAEYYHKEMTRGKQKVKSLSDRKENFIVAVSKHESEYEYQMLLDFISYWTEHNEGGKKMRFEMAKNQPFNIKRRLGTFKKNSERYNNTFKSPNNSKQNAMDLLRKDLGI